VARELRLPRRCRVRVTRLPVIETPLSIARRRYAIRILIRFRSDDLAYATVAGDNDRWAGIQAEWYDAYGAASEQIFKRDETHPVTDKYGNPDAFLAGAITLPVRRTCLTSCGVGPTRRFVEPVSTQRSRPLTAC
jgi:hypothetical protein